MIGRVILAWTYRFTLQAVFNFVFNVYHFARILFRGDLPRARYKLAISRADILGGGKPPKMRYQYDGIVKGDSVLGKWPCWTAIPLVFAGMYFAGNCMDGAYYMRRVIGGRVKVWIPDGKRWYARIHYVCHDKSGKVWSLEGKGLKCYKSLETCRAGGRWI